LEADDVLASAVAAARRAGVQSVVMTSDRDAFSLICAEAAVLRIINGGVEASPLMTAERLVLLLGVRPDQYRDFAALRGDPSDNLPGVRGIGPRSAAAILREFGTAAAAFADLDRVHRCLGAGIARRLGAPGAMDAWQLNCEVMTMRDDVQLPIRLDGGSGGPGMLPLPARAVEDVFRGLGMTWTTGPVRVLAEVETEPRDATPHATHVPWPAVTADDDVRHWSSYRPHRLPRLKPARAKAQQLSLFD
jgi:DNA polymerase-1